MQTRSSPDGPDLCDAPSPPSTVSRCLQQRVAWRGSRRRLLRGSVRNMRRKGLRRAERWPGALMRCFHLPSTRATRQYLYRKKYLSMARCLRDRAGSWKTAKKELPSAVRALLESFSSFCETIPYMCYDRSCCSATGLFFLSYRFLA